MPASKFEQICDFGFIDVDSFRENLGSAGLTETVETLPDDLYSLMRMNQRRKLPTLDFKEFTGNFLEQINVRMKLLPPGKAKSRLKSQIHAFAYYTVKHLQQDFPELRTIEDEIEKGVEEYQKKPETDVEDLLRHTELFRKERKLPAGRSEGRKASQSTCLGFVHHLAESFEKLNLEVTKKYQLTNSIADLRGIFNSKRKEVKPVSIKQSKLPLFICLVHRLWEERLISPHEGGFWETLSGCLVDGTKEFSEESLRKMHSRILKKPGKKHARIAPEVDALIKVATEKRTKN